MPLNTEAIRAYPFVPIEQTLGDTECMLYALSVGVGRDSLDADEFPYVFEEDLQVFPSMPVVLGRPGFWMGTQGLGINPQMLVHGTQRLRVHRPLTVGAPFVAVNRVLEFVDKGADRGALVVTERTLHDKATGKLLASMEAGTFCRADGGFGGPRTPSYEFAAAPDRTPDALREMPTDANQALFYRLNGDRNPLHASLAFAKKAGFERPILHGLCTYGIATHALMQHAGSGSTLNAIEARFSSPVFPGETIRFEIWNKPDGVAFRALVDARRVVVLDRGLATLS
jgi:acyl dehydratase